MIGVPVDKKPLAKRATEVLTHLYFTWLGPVVRRVVPPAKPQNADGRVLVHLGCGEERHPGYVNVDARPMPHVHYVTGELDMADFAPESVDLIYACHVLEHFPFKKVPELLRTWRSKLKPGGVVRLSVPDFACIVAIYQERRDLTGVLPALMGGQDYPTNFHYTAFDEASLRSELLGAGFTSVRAWDPKTAGNHGFDDWSGRKVEIGGRAYPISLNLEGVR